MASELEDYINQARQAGKNDETIKGELRSSGWQEANINLAFGVPSVLPAPTAPTAPTPPGSFSATSFLDAKTKETVIWSAVGYFCRELIIKLSLAIFAMLFTSSVNVYGYRVGLGSGLHLNFFNLIFSSLIFG